MAAYNGFGAATPDTKYGDTSLSQSASYATAQKFTAPSSGTLDLTEIGVYGHGNGSTVAVKMAVYTHDAANDCPESQVSNSEATISLTGSDYVKVKADYGATKPQITGGGTYWIAAISDGAPYYSAFAAAGELEVGSVTYPTWPTATAWETHAHYDYDLSFYAVYQAASGVGQAPRSTSYFTMNW